MQLTIEVLPAPLGPIIENSSPSFTPKETSVSARTPPKRSDTPRTSKACSTHSLRQRVFREINPVLCDRPIHSGYTIVPVARSLHVMPGLVPGIHVLERFSERKT